MYPSMTNPGMFALGNVSRVAEESQVVNASAVVYTCPTGAIALIGSLFIQMNQTAAGVGSGSVLLRDSLGATITTWRAGVSGTGVWLAPVPFSVPLKLLAGDDIYVSSGTAGFYVSASIVGVEVSL